jgi:photosystem II stability/assembly factor-like uncharacterized protein
MTGGPAAIVVADPHSPRTFLAGTRNALLYRTTDAGVSWTTIPFPAQLQATLNALVIDPGTPGVYLAGLSGDVPDQTGILRSTDSGATWRAVPDLHGQQVRAIVFKRASSQIIAVGTDSGVFASQDGGATWARISPEDNARLRPAVALTFDPGDSSTLYAGTPHLPWKTTDGGGTWRSIHEGMLDDSDIFSIQVDRNRPQRVFASACSGIYRSLDGAATWTRLVDAKDASYRTYTIVQDLQYENVWYAGTTHGLVRSADGGATWQKLRDFATRSIAFDPSYLGRILVATEEAGILRSDDNGRSWREVNNGFSNQRLSSLWTSEGAAYAATVDGRVLQLSADLTRWTAVEGAPAMPPPAPVSVSGLGSDTVQAVCHHPRRASLMYAAKFGMIYASADSGRTWKTISPDRWPIRSVTQLTILPGSPDRLLVLSRQQGVWELPLER